MMLALAVCMVLLGLVLAVLAGVALGVWLAEEGDSALSWFLCLWVFSCLAAGFGGYILTLGR